jgi:hypothetical protein
LVQEDKIGFVDSQNNKIASKELRRASKRIQNPDLPEEEDVPEEVQENIKGARVQIKEEEIEGLVNKVEQ